MKKIYFTIFLTLIVYFANAQSQVITTGNNVVNAASPYAADVVMGSDQGTRHDASMMWWSNASASHISNTSDVFYMSVWNTTNSNIGLNAAVGGNSYFRGNLGIGTTTPAGLLSLGSGIQDNKLLLFETGNYQWGFGIQNQQFEQYFATDNTANHFSWGGMSYDGNHTFPEFMRLDGYGNVCIGTVNPNSYKLSVRGTIHAQSVVVDQIGWSDFVFDKHYHLTPLAKVNAYIAKNHHLPDMPSEAQIVNDGQDIGAMNNILTKKVEELTLYMIEKDNQISKQQRQIDDVNNMLKVHSKEKTKISS
jgi:hypothetical protein